LTNIEANKYNNVDDFVSDVELIWINCRTYNQDGSTYVKWYIKIDSSANKLEKFFKEKMKILKIEMGIV
jgi:histone acetyltransferase